MAGTITLEEFQKLQQSFMEYKEKYMTSEEKVKHLTGKIQALQKSAPSSSSGWFSGGGNKQQELQRENENLTKSINQLKEEFNAQSSALKDNLRSLFEENEQLQEKLKQSEKATSDSGDSELIETLRKENEELKQQLQSTIEKNESQSHSEQTEQNNQQLEEKLKSLESQLENAQSQLEESRSLYSALQNESQSKPSDESESASQTQLEESESQRKTLQNELDAEKSHSKSLQTELETTQTRLTSLQEQFDRLEKNFNSKSDENSNSDETLKTESLSNQIHSLQSELQRAQSESQSASNEVEQLQKDILSLNQSIHEKETALKSNQNLLQESVSQLEASQNELAQAKSLQESLEIQLSEQTQKSALFQQNLDQLSQDLAAKSNELAAALEKTALAEEESKRAQIETSNAREELSLTQNDRSVVISKMTEKDLENDTLRDELQTARIRIDELQSSQDRTPELEELVSLKTQKVRQLREQIDKLREENLAWEKDKVRFDTVQQEAQEVRTALTKLTEKYSRVENELNSMSIRKEEVVTRNLEQMEEIKQEHQQALKSLQERIDSQESQIGDLHSQLEESREKFNVLDASNAETKSELKIALDELEPLRKEFLELQESSREAGTKFAEIQEQLALVEGKLVDSERDLNEARLKNGIDAKKFQRLIQDLQTQLQKARSEKPEFPASTSQGTALSSQSSSALERTASSGEVARPSPARIRPVRVSSDQVAQPAAPMIPQDIEALALHVGELQKRNFALEEHIKKLRLKMKEYQKELATKSRVIQTHMPHIQLEGRSTPQMDKNKVQRAVREQGIMGRIFGGNSRELGDPHLQAEINAKMARVLEDTLMKNVQLQADMETMGNEILKLEKENSDLLAKSTNPTSTTPDDQQ